MSQAAVRALLGEPDEVGGFSRKHRRPRILKYGAWELHFGPSLWLIFTDTDLEALTPSQVRQLLEAEDIPFRGDDECLVTEAGVELRFTPLLESLSKRALDGVGESLLL